MEEDRFQDILHKMSHTKVISSYKRGYIEITKKNISTLFYILKQNDYKYSKK